MSSSNGSVHSLPEHVRFAIAGSGFAGIGCGIRLKQAGIHDFVILERADDVGGTWRDNTYPGCACDVPSHLYSFSFEPNPRWSRTFSPQPEIWDYLRHCSSKYGIDPHVRVDPVLARAVAKVVPDLGLRRERAAPARIGLEGEGVEVARHVAGAAGVRVVAPGSANVVRSLEDHEVMDAGLLEPDAAADPREAAARDREADVLR